MKVMVTSNKLMSTYNQKRITQEWNSELYIKNASFVSELGNVAFDILSPCFGEKILDLGCGDGRLTKMIIECGSKVLGIDSSLNQVRAARSIGVDAYEMDAHDLKFVNEFDAVFSNAALHWMKDIDSVLLGVAKALKPGGRFIAEFGGFENVKTITSAIEEEIKALYPRRKFVNPWYLPKEDEYKMKLQDKGFLVKKIELVSRPTALPGDIGGWLDVFAGSFFSFMSDKEKKIVRNNIVSNLKKKICDKNGVWWADYVRLRFSADHF